MLELRPLLVSVVTCLARPESLDAMHVEGAATFRVAEDETFLLSGPADAEAIAKAAAAQLEEAALVVDHSDAFAGLTLDGDDAHEAFCRLSALVVGSERPWRGQGLVAHVPTKILASNGGLHLLVPSTLGHHVRQRVLDACRGLQIVEAEAAEFQPAEALQPIA